MSARAVPCPYVPKLSWKMLIHLMKFLYLLISQVAAVEVGMTMVLWSRYYIIHVTYIKVGPQSIAQLPPLQLPNECACSSPMHQIYYVNAETWC